jgi:hypothetical protein
VTHGTAQPDVAKAMSEGQASTCHSIPLIRITGRATVRVNDANW